MRVSRPDPPPYEVDLVPLLAAGSVAWGIALVALAATGPGRHGWWLLSCALGLLLGLTGLLREGTRRRRPPAGQLWPSSSSGGAGGSATSSAATGTGTGEEG